MSVSIRHGSIYGRLIGMFVAMAVLLELLCAAAFLWGQGVVERELIHSAAQDLRFIRDELSGGISGIEQAKHQLINDTTVRHFALNHQSMSKSEYYTQVKSICSLLGTIVSNNTYVAEITVYVPSAGLAIRHAGTLLLSLNEAQTLIEQIYESENEIYERDELWLMGLCFPSYTRLKKTQPLFFVEFTLSTDGIRRLLETFTVQKDSSITLTNQRTGSSLHAGVDFYTETGMSRTLTDEADARLSYEEIAIGDGTYYVVRDEISLPQLGLESCAPLETIVGPPRRFIVLLTAVSATLALFLVIYALAVYRDVRRPVQWIVAAFHRLEEGDMTARMEGRCNFEFADIANGFDAMTVKLSRLIEEKYMSELYLRNIELKQLQSQMNPHFFYNNFFMLRRLITDEDNETALKLVSHLGQYYQFIARNDRDVLPLRDEFNHAMEYLNIQKMRFENKLCVEVDELPVACEAWRVPRLILQPVIENAFEHGDDRVKQVTHVHVSFAYADDMLRVSVDDDGAGMSDETMNALRARMENVEAGGEGVTGLVNIDRRLKLRFMPGSGVRLARSAYGGTRVILIIIQKEAGE